MAHSTEMRSRVQIGGRTLNVATAVAVVAVSWLLLSSIGIEAHETAPDAPRTTQVQPAVIGQELVDDSPPVISPGAGSGGGPTPFID